MNLLHRTTKVVLRVSHDITSPHTQSNDLPRFTLRRRAEAMGGIDVL